MKTKATKHNKDVSHTFRTKAWITEYSGVTPQGLIDGKNLDGLTFHMHDMKSSGWTYAGIAEIKVTLVDVRSLIENKVEALKQQAIGIRAEATAKCTRIESQIQELLAISYEPTTEVAQ